MTGLVSATLLVSCCVRAAQAAEPVRLVFQNNYPSKHSRLGNRTVGKWLDEVEKASGGSITIERHWAGEPFPASEALYGLSRGAIDILCALPPYYSGMVAIADVCAMPQNFARPEDVYDLWFNSDMGRLIDQVYRQRCEVTALFPVVFAPENFQVSARSAKIRSFADFNGKKIRAGGGMLMETIKALGASPVHTHGGEYYTAMQRGTVDAGLMTTYSLETYRMWEVADQVVNPPIMSNCFVLVLMNLHTWNTLDSSLQTVLIDTARQLMPAWTAFVAEDDARIAALAQTRGVEFFVLSEADQRKMWAATEQVWDLYVQTCARQGAQQQARAIRSLIMARAATP